MRLNGLFLPTPQVIPVLDPSFRPPVLAHRVFRSLARSTGAPVPIELALEQADGSVFRFRQEVLPETHEQAAANVALLERWLKFLLWSRGGFRFHFAGPKSLADALDRHYRESATGRFDADIMGRRIYDQPLEVRHCRLEELPPERAATKPLGRHLEGCRIGFDLGGSDRKVGAVIEGRPVFSEEIVW
ncbi:MAG: ROK family protein, partial [Limisphaerales bacterium]